MGSVQIEQKSYEMPPKDGMSIAHFLTVKDIERSARYYEKVFGARILSLGDGNAPGYLQLANIWMIVNVGGGPTVDKPTVSLSVPDPNHYHHVLHHQKTTIKTPTFRKNPCKTPQTSPRKKYSPSHTEFDRPGSRFARTMKNAVP
jgi:hypothetical protein